MEAAKAPSSEKKDITVLPSVRIFAIQQKVDLNLVNGTGPGGRILKSDVEGHIAQKSSAQVQKKEQPVQQAPAPKSA